MTLVLEETRWRALFNSVQNASGKLLGIVMVRKGSADTDQTPSLHALGTVARVGKVSMADGQVQFMAEGLKRFRVTEWLSPRTPFSAEVEYLNSMFELENKHILKC